MREFSTNAASSSRLQHDSVDGSVRVAVIGCGNQAHENLLPSIASISGLELVAVCDIDVDRARRTARQYRNITWYTDATSLLDLPEIDAVVLSGPPAMHFDLGIKALRAGHHLFVEKPPAVTLDQANALVQAAQQSSLVTMVGHNFRHAQPVIVVKNLIQCHALGPPVHMSVRFISNKPRQPMWGIDSLLWTQLMSMAVHPLDLMQAFLGRAVRVYAAAKEHPGGLLTVDATISFAHGGIATLHTGSHSPRFEVTIELADHRGQVLSIENLWKLSFRRQPPTTPVFNKLWSQNWEPSPLNGGYERSGYSAELRHFACSILTQVPADPSLVDYWHTIVLCRAVEQSVLEQRPIDIDTVAILSSTPARNLADVSR